MAEELRYEILKGTLTAGTVNDDMARFVNETGKDISVRKATLFISGNGMNAGDSAVAELSKDPTILSNTNNDTTPRIGVGIRAPESAAVVAGGHTNRTIESFAKGQWTLRPGEDLHINASKTTNVTGQVEAEVWWHVN